ncbi:MAG: efflux RND transporter periplasmic adaptor subunit [Colwellia sp.]|nr:efflux RND transporter periplasmic adaptor subunit [Colwellia sp.]
MKILYQSLFLNLIFLAFAQQILLAQEFPPASVNVDSAIMTELSPVVWVSATVVSQNNAKIAAEISGRLTSLSVIGARVAQGDVIAQIDDKQLKIQSREAQANVLNSKANLRFLAAEVIRKKQLFKQKLSPETELDKTISERDIAKGDVIVAQARLDKIEQNIAYTQLKAPFSGIVTQRIANLGEYVENGSAIIRLVAIENSEASVFVPIVAFQFLKKAKQLSVESPLGLGYAKIKALVPVANARSHLMEVRLDMSTFDWPIGLNFKAQVANGPSEMLLAVPRDALVLRRDGASVFRVNNSEQGSQAEKISVAIGVGMGGLIAVTSTDANKNLQAGDLMIIRGAERLQDGQRVVIKKNNHELISHHQEKEKKVADNKGKQP